MEKPLSIAKNNFINNIADDSALSKKHILSRTTFSLNSDDIETLENQIDRAVNLKKRTKSKTCIMRMALNALRDASDDKYLELYNKF
jgi:hypothetical protein